MEPILFTKMSGSGNDFIIIDNRTGMLDEGRLFEFIVGICRRRFSVGADGVILIETSQQADFRWRFFNSDGSPADMCGNGARCAARFAFREKIAGASMCFETRAGLVCAQVSEPRVRVRLTDPRDLELGVPITLASGLKTVSCVNTGVPHAVMQVDDLEALDVIGLGREIRFHPQFGPAGTNANFFQPEPSGGIAVRTYERGVEGETLACGTGVVAAALVAACTRNLASPVAVRTRGGDTLRVYFKQTDGLFSEVHQDGNTRLIYSGALCEEAWR